MHSQLALGLELAIAGGALEVVLVQRRVVVVRFARSTVSTRGSVALMHARMHGQRALVTEGLVTGGAVVGLFTGVDADVSGHGTLLVEGLVANRTGEGLFTGVDAKMCDQCTVTLESLFAMFTLEPLIVAVDAHMRLKGMLSRKLLVAHLTSKRLIARVADDVTREVAVTIESLATVRLGARVNLGWRWRGIGLGRSS